MWIDLAQQLKSITPHDDSKQQSQPLGYGWVTTQISGAQNMKSRWTEESQSAVHYGFMANGYTYVYCALYIPM